MAATAAAAVASSVSSSSINTLKCIRSNLLPSDLHLRITPPTRILASSPSHSFNLEPLSIAAASQKWRVMRITAAVAQEEVAVTAEVEEEEKMVEEEKEEDQQEEEEKVEEEQVVVGREGDKTVAGGDGVSVNTKLYFGNLPYSVDSAQLAGLIQDFASPELVEVLYDRETGRSRGFAFVTMSTIKDCNKVIENLDGSHHMGRTLRVNFSDKPKPKLPLYPETEYKLFVGNLSWSVTSESLTQAFQEYGNVVGARVLYDGETGRSRGYGFVCYATKSEMDIALQSLDGMELEGRAMRVSLAQGKRS
ncbi:30 kDa ribonucleoprotein, chloroplastic [Ziziphus jujuba]|uniref:30 kDa ribonucleoprotein, chloroplastic n=1 Tax=Ziziphus jujuba TaxID=326968 RepID=A0A6P4A1W7_ZIZJJ|nr:30 kDa ribonucleoprotein, chloroplastic [Ziziphus jujuba]